ncbi:Unknown protein, partial [Striga hermonthica]
ISKERPLSREASDQLPSAIAVTSINSSGVLLAPATCPLCCRVSEITVQLRCALSREIEPSEDSSSHVPCIPKVSSFEASDRLVRFLISRRFPKMGNLSKPP